jgi:hypothetical protein
VVCNCSLYTYGKTLLQMWAKTSGCSMLVFVIPCRLRLAAVPQYGMLDRAGCVVLIIFGLGLAATTTVRTVQGLLANSSDGGTGGGSTNGSFSSG